MYLVMRHAKTVISGGTCISILQSNNRRKASKSDLVNGDIDFTPVKSPWALVESVQQE